MYYRALTACVSLFLLAAILATPVFADGGGILPTDPEYQGNVHDGDGQEPLTTRLATALYPDDVQNLPYSVQIFDQAVYDYALPEGNEYRFTVFAGRLSNDMLSTDKAVEDKGLFIKLFVAGTATVENNKFVVNKPGTVLVTAIAYDPKDAKLIWVDSAQIVISRADG